jgi:molybdopterin-guanine dinucleotide biosynthesis protein A
MSAPESLSAVSAVILAGGSSARMQHRDKALLRWNGSTYLNRLSRELSCCGELLLSVDRPQKYPGCALPEVVDVRRCGPLGGICQALEICRFPWLLVVACDMPLFQRSLAERLLRAADPQTDAVVLRELSGRTHPLGALYAKASLPQLTAQLETGNYRMQDALNGLETVYLTPDAAEARMLRNVNTPEDADALRL